MPLASGARLGPYEITAPIGAGGMGEVYKARDTRLERTVAIKVLPAHLANNAEFRQRFEREAKVISSLNHPHICALYDIGEQDGVAFLVMEFLEGETLSARLAGGPLPLEQLLPHAIHIADALAEAQRHGVSHRDLKPGNVMLTRAGAKLLDFGLAKFAPASSTAATVDISPTQGLSAAGAILGTFQYMSPEQLTGKDADSRSDIFSFGAVLYEMATGRRAFPGQTPAALAGAILHTEPPAIAEHPQLDRVVKKCLAKDPEARWQSAADLRSQLQWLAENPAVPSAAAPDARRRKPVSWIIATAVATLAALFLAVAYFQRAPAPTAVTRFTIPVPEKTSLVGTLAFSPDGRRLATSMIVEGRRAIWVRSMDALTFQRLPGGEDGYNSFWSPDSRHIGFWVQGKLKRIDVSGGPPQTLCDAAPIASGDWNQDGIIIFGGPDGLHRVPAAGGVPAPVTKLDSSRQETFHSWPQFLPGGRRFLYLVVSADREKSGIYTGDLDTPPDSQGRKRLVAADVRAGYAPPLNGGKGHLLFLREATLMAQPFNPGALELAGEPFPVAEQVTRVPAVGFAGFCVSPTGALAFRSIGGLLARLQLTWFDRSGKNLGALGPPGEYANPRLSPDGRRVAVENVDQAGNRDIWIFELARGTLERFTFHGAADSSPVWSPDGRRIVFLSERDGARTLYQKDSGGAGAEEVLLKLDNQAFGPLDWSPDGRFLAYDLQSRKTLRDLWALPLGGDRKPFPFLQQEFSEYQGRFSPDSKLMAYTSDESQRAEVYVQAFPGGGAKKQISTAGGLDPQWRRDGKELFYLALDNKLMAVDVRFAPRFEAGVPKPLFEARYFIGSLNLSAVRNRYAVTADGGRFLFNSPTEEVSAAPVTVVLNWAAARRN